ncbi:MAG TPA: formylglycine-generating enzyme family protein [Syntrophomonas sp.]|nr:formylglycine-generating enzyme family protein [Syntrophomonas sp.]
MKYFMILAILMTAALAPAQDLVIQKKDGNLISVKVLDIDNISFTTVVIPPDTISPPPDTTMHGRMVWIPAGTFEMGSNLGADNEKPIHYVTLNGYWMDAYEVTNGQYRQFCDATSRPYPVNPTDNYFLGRPDYPTVNVTWTDAAAYAAWAGMSLPTEAEWEYAARGGLIGNQYPWGDTYPTDQCNYSNYSGPLTAQMANFSSSRGPLPVGSYAPNGYGLYDMAGNVMEWCADWYGSTYYSTSPAQNPVGPSTGGLRVLRGGSWLFSAFSMRVADRSYGGAPGNRDSYIGFRCVLRP